MPGEYYEVNMDLCICECPKGRLRGPCKHKHVVAEHFNLATPDVIPTKDPRVRSFYHFLATGVEKESSWYRDLATSDATPETQSYRDIFSFMRFEENDANNPQDRALA